MRRLSKEGQRRAFQIHAAAFAVALPIEILINVLTGPPYWVAWVLAGWSVGLLTHWFVVLGPGVSRG